MDMISDRIEMRRKSKRMRVKLKKVNDTVFIVEQQNKLLKEELKLNLTR